MVNVALHWIPGHAGVEGNEQADSLARAATRKESEPPQRDGVPWYLARIALKRAEVMEGPPPPKWAETGRFTRKIEAAFHTGKSAEMYRQLNSIEAAILTQLRTGKTFLNEYLHKIRAEDTAACDCGSIESTAHFLFACRRWRQQRAKLRQQHGKRFGDLSYALGGYSNRQEGGESIDGTMARWEADMEAVRATIEFAKSTGRLQPHERHVESRDEAEAEERRQLRIPSGAS
ncbi:reverse transcriptase [Paraphaeosphaeria sporulosa]